ncbi:MAG: VCBS repeat-containing protein, partial [Planctomycetota bacterium]
MRLQAVRTLSLLLPALSVAAQSISTSKPDDVVGARVDHSAGTASVAALTTCPVFAAAIGTAHGSAAWNGPNAKIVDFNGDGRADFVYTGDLDLWVRLSNGDGTFQAVVQAPHGSAGWNGPDAKMADVNGDGRADFVYTGDTDLW